MFKLLITLTRPVYTQKFKYSALIVKASHPTVTHRTLHTHNTMRTVILLCVIL